MVSARAFFHLFIHPSIFCTHVLLPSRSQGSARACPGCHGQLVLDKSPVHCRAASNDKERSTPVHTNTDNLKFLSRLTCTFEYTHENLTEIALIFNKHLYNIYRQLNRFLFFKCAFVLFTALISTSQLHWF